MKRSTYILILICLALLIVSLFIKLFTESIDPIRLTTPETTPIIAQTVPAIVQTVDIMKEEPILPLTKEEVVAIPLKEKVISTPSRGIEGRMMTATYYTWTGNRTATGTWPQEGRTVAVDPKVIPLGTHLVIDGIGGYIAEDTGGVIHGNKVDIYKSSRSECIRLGVRTVTIQIVK